jgi:hypothetical protein
MNEIHCTNFMEMIGEIKAYVELTGVPIEVANDPKARQLGFATLVHDSDGRRRRWYMPMTALKGDDQNLPAVYKQLIEIHEYSQIARSLSLKLEPTLPTWAV